MTVPEGVSAVWTSSNSNVASVVNGEITAVAQGSAKIIVSAGNEKDTCLVNVSLSVQSLTLDVESDTTRVQRDGTLQLKLNYILKERFYLNCFGTPRTQRSLM